MKRISGEEIARIWNGDNDSGSEHDEAPANMIDFLPADEAQAEFDTMASLAATKIEQLWAEIERLKNSQTAQAINALQDIMRKDHQAEIDELVEMLEEVEDLIEQHTKRDGVLMALINWAKKSRKLVAQCKGE